MNKLFALIFVCFIGIPAFGEVLAQKQSDPPAPQPSSVSSSVLKDAQALVEIYYKIRTLSGDPETSELQPYLQRLNLVLDQVIAFKASFTPEKRAKIDKDLDGIKKEVAKLAELPASKMRPQLTALTDQIWKLTKTLLE